MAGDHEELDRSKEDIRSKQPGDKWLARLLGYAVITGSTMYKLPQIMRIHRARSARGISLLTASLDTANYLFSGAYSFAHHHPISGYGENVPQLVSICIIILQILRYEYGARATFLAACGCTMVAATVAICFAPILLGARIGNALLRSLKASTMAMSLTGTLPQIIQNWKARSAGELSLATSSLGLLGSWVRMYTVLRQLAGDGTMVAAQSVSVLSNSLLVLQIAAYGRPPPARPPRA